MLTLSLLRARSRVAALLLMTAALSATACGGDSPTRPEPPVVARVVMAPTTLTVIAGDTVRFTTTAYDAAGMVLPEGTVRVTATPGLTLVAPGRAIAIQSGILLATAGTQRDSLVVTVNPAVNSVLLNTTDVPLAQGDTFQLVATPRAGNDPVNRPVQFTSANPAIATVDATGRIVAGATLGRTTITVMSETVRRTVDVTTRDSTTGAFQITVRFLGTVDPRVQDAARRAARRWAQVLHGDLPDQLVQSRDGQFCGLPALDETVDDVLIFVDVRPLAGGVGVAGAGGVCLTRAGTRLPVLGTATVNATALDGLVQNGTLETTLTHEFGHALGFGSTWRLSYEPTLADLVSGRGTTDPGFTGPAARVAAAQGGATASASALVPVQAPDEAHWRTLGPLALDLMSPAGGPRLTAVTAGAMADLGYTIASGGVDLPAGTTPPASLVASTSRSGVGSTRPARPAASEHLQHPSASITRSGRVVVR